jgi:hypothetical protein
MTGNRGPRRGASVQAGPDKHMGNVLDELLRAEEGWQSESSCPAEPAAHLAGHLAALRARLEAGGLAFSTDEMAAIAQGRYVPIKTTEFLSRVGHCVRPAKENFRALSQQCAFDIVAAQLGHGRACILLGWEQSRDSPEAGDHEQ